MSSFFQSSIQCPPSMRAASCPPPVMRIPGLRGREGPPGPQGLQGPPGLLSFVTTDNTLSGDGTPDNPLSIPSGIIIGDVLDGGTY